MILETFTYCEYSLLPVKLMFKALEFLPSWLIWDSRCFCFSFLAPSYSSVAGSSEMGLVCCKETPGRACLFPASLPTAPGKSHGAVCVLCGVDTLLPRVPPCVSRAASTCVLSATFCAFPRVAALPLTLYLGKQMMDQNNLVGMGQAPAERPLGIIYAFLLQIRSSWQVAAVDVEGRSCHHTV